MFSGACGDDKGFFCEDLWKRLSFLLIFIIKTYDVFSYEFISFAVSFVKIDFPHNVLKSLTIRIFSMGCHKLAQTGIIKSSAFKFVVFPSFGKSKLTHQL